MYVCICVYLLCVRVWFVYVCVCVDVGVLYVGVCRYVFSTWEDGVFFGVFSVFAEVYQIIYEDRKEGSGSVFK